METFITTFFKALKYSEEANTWRKVCQPASHFTVDEDNILWLEFLFIYLDQILMQYYQNNKY